MRNKLKVVLSILAIFSIFWYLRKLTLLFLSGKECDYEFIDNDAKRYYSMFQDSVIQNLSNYYSTGNNLEALYVYKYKEKIRFVIWELNEFNAISPNSIFPIKNGQIKWSDYIAYNSTEIGPYPSILLKSGLCLNNQNDITINFTKESSYSKLANFEYEYFYGFVNKFSFSNQLNEELIIATLEKVKVNASNTGILLLKKGGTFFLIVINSLDGSIINEQTLNYLNLK